MHSSHRQIDKIVVPLPETLSINKHINESSHPLWIAIASQKHEKHPPLVVLTVIVRCTSFLPLQQTRSIIPKLPSLSIGGPWDPCSDAGLRVIALSSLVLPPPGDLVYMAQHHQLCCWSSADPVVIPRQDLSPSLLLLRPQHSYWALTKAYFYTCIKQLHIADSKKSCRSVHTCEPEHERLIHYRSHHHRHCHHL